MTRLLIAIGFVICVAGIVSAAWFGSAWHARSVRCDDALARRREAEQGVYRGQDEYGQSRALRYLTPIATDIATFCAGGP